MHNNPYVGPRPYERADRDKFFGRGREARDLLALMLAERVLLFYAQSGAGKTSLLNAQVIPALEDKGFDVLPVPRVGSDLPPGIDPAAVANVFVFSVLMGLAGGDVAPETLLEHTLLSFLASCSLAPRGRPQDGHEGLDYGGAGGTDKPPLLILDQFEELFTTHRDRWQEARDFFVQMRQALEGIPNLGVTLAMREDHIAELDPYAPLLPGRLRARFRMECLGPQAAVEAVAKPAADAGCPFAAGLAERLVDDLRRIKGQETGFLPETRFLGPYVEPVQLQVVCNRLWERLPDQPDNAIQWEEVEQYGNIDRALVDFYESALSKTCETCQVFRNLTGLTLTERQLRRWFSEELITLMETRGLAMRGPDDTAGLPNAAVDALEAQHIIRADVRAGARWYELSHDRMVEPILQSNRAWEQEQESLHPWRLVARQWEKAPSESLLYRGKELEEAQGWLDAATPDEVESYEHEFIKASLQAEAERLERYRRRRRLTAISVVVGILMIALTVVAVLQWQAAARAENEAQVASTLAVERQRTAEAASTLAVEQKATAEAERLRADEKAEDARIALVAANAAATAEAIARQEAETLRQIAVARQLAAQGQALVPSPTGLLLAVESLSITSTIESRQAICQGLRQLLPLTTRIEYEAQIASVAFTPNGEWIAVGSYDGLVYVSDTTTGQEITRLMCIEGIQKLVFSPDGNWLAIRSTTEVELRRVGNWESTTFSILDEKVTDLAT